MTTDLTFLLVVVSVGFALAVLLTSIFIKVASQKGFLDIPNERSSHSTPVPRGGGLSIVVVFLGTVLTLWVLGEIERSTAIAFVLGGGLVAGIGFIDDRNHVPAGWRFLVQMIAAIFAVSILGGLPILQIGGQFVDLGLLGDVTAIIFAVWFINLYNFMDGIDGIAGVEAICIAGGVIAIHSTGDNGGFITVLLFVVIGAISGFLVWNWPPAKIFMGDVGSGFIGFVLAMFAIAASNEGLLPIWCWLVLAGVFVVDSTVTLVTRVINGERWYSAHSNHVYQKASRRMKGHRPVTLAVLAINVLWLLPIAWFAAARPEFGWWLTLIAWSPLMLIALLFKAGRPDLDA